MPSGDQHVTYHVTCFFAHHLQACEDDAAAAACVYNFFLLFCNMFFDKIKQLPLCVAESLNGSNCKCNVLVNTMGFCNLL
jgi:hypothetical protein